MSEKISHEGTVESVQPGHLVVHIVQTSACAACGARNLCRSAESKDKFVDVYTADALAYQKGQVIRVEGRTSMGMKAVRLAFLYPLVLLLVVMIIGMKYTHGDEVVSAICALAVILIWYIFLCFFRKRLQDTFAFHIGSDVPSGDSPSSNPGGIDNLAGCR